MIEWRVHTLFHAAAINNIIYEWQSGVCTHILIHAAARVHHACMHAYEWVVYAHTLMPCACMYS